MAAFDDYENYDGLGLAALVAQGEVSAEELLEAAIARIEARNPAFNAVVHKLYDHARAAIAAGLPAGPFTGVPYLLKDLYTDLEGTPCENGSRLFAGYVSRSDGPQVTRSKAAGLVILGKTTTAELGLTVSTETTACGPTRNPWNSDHSSGGSSGGAASAVAAGMVPLAHGSDGGGSIRIPASECGLFGLKPSRARVPCGEGWAGMATHHAVTRSVRDSAALLDATHGLIPGYPYSAPDPKRPFLQEVGADPGRLRIAWTAEPFAAEVSVDPECRQAAEDAARLAESLGHEVVEAAPDIDIEALSEAMLAIVTAETARILDEEHPSESRPVREGDVERLAWNAAVRGRDQPATAYAAAIERMHKIGRKLGLFLEDYDVLLSPTLAALPPPIGLLDPESEDIDLLIGRILPYVAYTRTMNMSGQPAASLPLAWSDSGLPIGVQIAGRFGDEATLLRLSAQFEAARPWFDRRAPLQPLPGEKR